jgi:hypothetical protein
LKDVKKIDRLRTLSDLILNQHLAGLRACANARNQSLQRLNDLMAKPDDQLSPVASAAAALQYERWAELRRSELNIILSRQTVAWMEARKAAETAFGRSEVLKKL